jgi:predicted DNA-binding ribbon-helix-helix protein
VTSRGRCVCTDTSPVKKRSIGIVGRKTAVSLEDEFWAAAHEIVRARRITLTGLIASLCHARNLSSAIRVSVLEHYQNGRPLAPDRCSLRRIGADADDKAP